VQDGKQDGSTFCSDDDSLILEDTSGRISLGQGPEGSIKLPVGGLVTGLSAAVRGSVDADGILIVSAIAFAGLSLPKAMPASGQSASARAGKSVLFVSDVGFGDGSCDPLPR